MGDADRQGARLGFDGTRPELREGLRKIGAFMQDRVHRFRNRHVHAKPPGQIDDGDGIDLSLDDNGLAVETLVAALAFAGCTPSDMLRDVMEEQVSVRSPAPERPVTVSLLPPRASARNFISSMPRAINAARVFSAKPAPVIIPQAIAITFLTAPPISTPTRSSEM